MNIKSKHFQFLMQVTLLFSCIILAVGCNKQVDISNFDEEAWRLDKMACNDQRGKLVEDLLISKQELIDLTQQEVAATLGKPEMQELYTRGQKFFIYHLTPGPKCEDTGTDTVNSKLLYIRFSALNEVSEIFVK